MLSCLNLFVGTVHMTVHVLVFTQIIVFPLQQAIWIEPYNLA